MRDAEFDSNLRMADSVMAAIFGADLGSCCMRAKITKRVVDSSEALAATYLVRDTEGFVVVVTALRSPLRRSAARQQRCGRRQNRRRDEPQGGSVAVAKLTALPSRKATPRERLRLEPSWRGAERSKKFLPPKIVGAKTSYSKRRAAAPPPPMNRAPPAASARSQPPTSHSSDRAKRPRAFCRAHV